MTRIQRWTIQCKADAVDRFLDDALAPLIVALTAIAFIYGIVVIV